MGRNTRRGFEWGALLLVMACGSSRDTAGEPEQAARVPQPTASKDAEEERPDAAAPEQAPQEAAPRGPADAMDGMSKSSAGPAAAPAKQEASVKSNPADAACAIPGKFALRQQYAMRVAGLPGLEDLEDSVDARALVELKEETGKLVLELVSCGQIGPDVCGVAVPPLLPKAEAFGQFLPAEVLAKLKPEPVRITLDRLKRLEPKSAFDTPSLPQLTGIALEDPLGAWPKGRAQVEGGPDYAGQATNGARWVDIDADGAPGLSSSTVPPGGIAADAPHGPMTSIAATSSKCPRKDEKAERSAYAYLPASDGLAVARIKRLQFGQRLITELHGSVESCDRITGKLTGPDGAAPQVDELFAGCVKADASGESACASSVIEHLGSTEAARSFGATMSFAAGEFEMLRVAADASCAEVWKRFD